MVVVFFFLVGKRGLFVFDSCSQLPDECTKLSCHRDFDFVVMNFPATKCFVAMVEA